MYTVQQQQGDTKKKETKNEQERSLGGLTKYKDSLIFVNFFFKQKQVFFFFFFCTTIYRMKRKEDWVVMANRL